MKRMGFLAALALFLTGCRSFEKDWEHASATSADPAAGRWIGTWQNTNNTHSGPLRAVVVPVPGGYRARFEAGWGRHSGSFRTRLRGTPAGDAVEFEGRRRILGVKITTRGRADGKSFEATYDSRFDRGSFEMRRPGTDGTR